MTERNAGGFTLVEMVIAIVVISIGLGSILMTFNQNTARSADPMLLAQARAAAQAYLEEILLKDYAVGSGPEAGETRPNYDDIDDYHGLVDNGCLATTPACPNLGDCACNQDGDPMAALAGFQVTVSVVADAINGVGAMRVDVRVRHPNADIVDVALSGYRAGY